MSGPSSPKAATSYQLSNVGRIALLGRLWFTAVRVRYLLARKPLDEVIVSLSRSQPGQPMPQALLSRAVSRGLRIGPWQPRCLIRSLVLYRLVRAQGDPAELVIGLPHRPTSEEAHSWVEMSGRDIGPYPGGRGYQELTRYPRSRKPNTNSLA